MANKIKCSRCKKSYDSSIITTKGQKKYCPDCLEIQNQENEDWSILFEYCKGIFGQEILSVRIITQLQKYKKDELRPLTSIGMYYTLKYCKEILNKDFTDEEGVGIIPWYYEQARKHYNNVFDIEDEMENFKFKFQQKVIKTKLNKSPIKTRKEIPLEDTWEEEE